MNQDRIVIQDAGVALKSLEVHTANLRTGCADKRLKMIFFVIPAKLVPQECGGNSAMKWKIAAFAACVVGQSSAMAQTPAVDPTEPLLLECPGEMSVTSTITDGNNDDVNIDQKSSASVQVEITDGAGRVRLPRKMFGLINSGTDGWFKMSDLEIEPDHISAGVRISMIRTKRLEIDRRTGNIRIEGGSTFYGRCDRRPTANRF